MFFLLNKWLTVLSLFFTTSFLPLSSHPFFVSVTEIEHNEKEKTLEISCKVFTDDFEKTLRENYKTSVDLLHPKDKPAMNKLVNDYVRKHLQITADGKVVQLAFIGYEQDEEATWCYFEATNIVAVKKIEVIDSLLYEYKKEQINILHVMVNGTRKSTKLDNPEVNASFWF